mmetsp:Transcript_37213/g.58816  ORF Transcript_37213/g.58816 Transcript_37213/m.58816 type:complete len:137 (+) Transcript_37213:53-463(+)
MAARRCAVRSAVLLCLVAIFLDAACDFVGHRSSAVTAGTGRVHNRVVVKSMTPPDIQLPFMDAPIPGFTFAVYCFGALILVCLFGAYQLWRLFFSRELGTYAEIKWGGARPPKEYIEEMKRLEARRKKKFLRSITD